MVRRGDSSRFRNGMTLLTRHDIIDAHGMQAWAMWLHSRRVDNDSEGVVPIGLRQPVIVIEVSVATHDAFVLIVHIGYESVYSMLINQASFSWLFFGGGGRHSRSR